MTAEMVTKRRADKIWKAQPYLKELHTFMPGQKVRVAVHRGLFDKGVPTYSKEIHTVKGINGYRAEIEDGRKYPVRDVLRVSEDTVPDEPLRKAVPRTERLKERKVRHELKMIDAEKPKEVSNRVLRSGKRVSTIKPLHH